MDREREDLRISLAVRLSLAGEPLETETGSSLYGHIDLGAEGWLIYGNFGFPELGAVGCGHATSAVWWAQAVAMAVYVARRPRYRDLDLANRIES